MINNVQVFNTLSDLRLIRSEKEVWASPFVIVMCPFLLSICPFFYLVRLHHHKILHRMDVHISHTEGHLSYCKWFALTNGIALTTLAHI